MITKFDNSDELWDFACLQIRGWSGSAYHRKLTSWTQYGKETKHYMGYICVGTDSGDVTLYACEANAANDDEMLKHWNESIDRALKQDFDPNDEPRTFILEWWAPHFGDLGVGVEHVSLWG